MIRINLLPKEVREKGKGTEWVVLACLILTVMLLFGYFSHQIKLNRYKNDLARKSRWSAELAEIKMKVDRVTELDKQRDTLNAKKNTVVLLLQGRILYPMFMEHVFETLPKDIWISDFKLTEDASKNIAVEAKSDALTIDSVADWLQTLESRTDRFSGVDLSAIELKSGGTETSKAISYGFTMKFTYRPPAGT
ncbi:MAG: hypothetical protein A2901_07195 [Elusimicrobia bacterium RIFCSPLOWO2_01_FULL_54_10]|nr:MAG: hypothetical protein A2901_07195 [Elusimicrobia bacterium RIFCSPLOWO2_01_FULL_54_10]